MVCGDSFYKRFRLLTYFVYIYIYGGTINFEYVGMGWEIKDAVGYFN
jgi:hypothetical protein